VLPLFSARLCAFLDSLTRFSHRVEIVPFLYTPISLSGGSKPVFYASPNLALPFYLMCAFPLTSQDILSRPLPETPAVSVEGIAVRWPVFDHGTLFPSPYFFSSRLPYSSSSPSSFSPSIGVHSPGFFLSSTYFGSFGLCLIRNFSFSCSCQGNASAQKRGWAVTSFSPAQLQAPGGHVHPGPGNLLFTTVCVFSFSCNPELFLEFGIFFSLFSSDSSFLSLVGFIVKAA